MSKIEWTEQTWNPIAGCSIVSKGCTNCYAMKMAARIEATGTAPHYAGLTQPSKGGPVWTGKIALAPEATLLAPLRRKKPKMYFVNSMSDLFHEDVPDAWIDRIFAVMALCPQHTFQILTKRPERMRDFMTERWQPAPAQRIEFPGIPPLDMPAERRGEDRSDQVRAACEAIIADLGLADTDNDALWTDRGTLKIMQWAWPLPNVWLGTSVEDQQRADERIPALLDTPAAVRFISAEPLLGPIDLVLVTTPSGFVDALGGSFYDVVADAIEEWPRLDWVIVGGESGPGARPMHPDWARSLRDQCAAAGAAFFFKQWGEFVSVSEVEGPGAHHRFPDGAMVRRTGKKLAGRTLDHVEHNAMPVQP